jgi:hypothetical protein
VLLNPLYCCEAKTVHSVTLHRQEGIHMCTLMESTLTVTLHFFLALDHHGHSWLECGRGHFFGPYPSMPWHGSGCAHYPLVGPSRLTLSLVVPLIHSIPQPQLSSTLYPRPSVHQCISLPSSKPEVQHFALPQATGNPSSPTHPFDPTTPAQLNTLP